MPKVADQPARRGPRPRPIVAYPKPLYLIADEPDDFADALCAQMRRHGETAHGLFRALKAAGAVIDYHAILHWSQGRKTPQAANSLDVLKQIETRYRLAPGYLSERLSRSRAAVGQAPASVSRTEARRLAWHLPDDFSSRSGAEQAEILAWVREHILSGATAYRRYQTRAARDRFGLRFEGRLDAPMAAPLLLRREMADLLRFKSSTLTEIGFQRSGVWNAATAAQRREHLSLMFGAMTAEPSGPVRGLGLPREALTFGLLVFPQVWDWYVRWRELRRGFYTVWETDMLLNAAAFTRMDTGWLRQSPWLADRLTPIAELISATDVARARADWSGACDKGHRHALARAKEIQRVTRVHRDPFEPVLPVLEAKSPVGEYRKIADEVVRRLPDARRQPLPAAEAVRSILMLRLGLHLGLRQRNLRELLVCPRGSPHRSERDLETLKRGELRWSERENGWEVFIPCAAFKNAGSAYFSKQPYRLTLPDLDGLYDWLDLYLRRDRRRLLKGAPDDGTFFVKTVKRSSRDTGFTQSGFYEAWRTTIQRYGIFNPWTGKGAIIGLMAHGPHAVRDVLATHVLKKTGSYEQASYAIQDTPATVAAHYGRFLPQDKAALAAKIVNAAWAA